MEPALALIEFNSIAVGIQAGDAMVKKAPIASIKAGTVQAGKYLVLITGQVAEVVVETSDVAAIIQAADAGVKGAEVTLREIRLADGLGGKAFCLFRGEVQDVEAAMEIGIGSLPDPVVLVNQVVIPQLHPEMGENLLVSGYFAERIGREKGW
jgi:microcompartment protein CcmL/EutN